MTTRFKYGKKPARPGAARLLFHNYLDTAALPAIPDTYGHQSDVTNWGMLANDAVGDCAIAAPLHAIKLWAAETGHTVNITDKAAIQNYSEITNYDPTQTQPDGSNLTDQGTDVQQMLEHWRTTGLVDDDGNRHTIAGYVGLQLGSALLDEMKAADYLLDGLIIGINCPSQYQDNFNNLVPWDAVENPNYEGGHCILGVGKPDAGHDICTWGGLIDFLPAGITQNVDEVWAVISNERVNASSGVDVNGFRMPQLIADLPLLGQAA